jgi:hypothetical protein
MRGAECVVCGGVGSGLMKRAEGVAVEGSRVGESGGR